MPKFLWQEEQALTLTSAGSWQCQLWEGKLSLTVPLGWKQAEEGNQLWEEVSLDKAFLLSFFVCLFSVYSTIANIS